MCCCSLCCSVWLQCVVAMCCGLSDSLSRLVRFGGVVAVCYSALSCCCSVLQRVVVLPQLFQCSFSQSDLTRNSFKYLKITVEHLIDHCAGTVASCSAANLPNNSNCNTLLDTATRCNTLQHTATHCNTLQHTAHQCNLHT